LIPVPTCLHGPVQQQDRPRRADLRAARAGDAAATALLQRLLRAGCGPYFCTLERWLCEGVLDDPFAEFMVQEDPARPCPARGPGRADARLLARTRARVRSCMSSPDRSLCQWDGDRHCWKCSKHPQSSTTFFIALTRTGARAGGGPQQPGARWPVGVVARALPAAARARRCRAAGGGRRRRAAARRAGAAGGRQGRHPGHRRAAGG